MVGRPPTGRRVTAAMLCATVALLTPQLTGCTIGAESDAAAGAAALPSASAPASASASASASEQAISMLFSLTAESGTLTPKSESPSEFTLTLSTADAHTIWFSDRPAHIAGTIPTVDLIADWADFGFAAAPPNVAIVLHDGPHEADTLIAELSHPSFDEARHTLTATVIVEDEATGSDGKSTFEHFASRTDSGLPASFSGVSVFINDVAGNVVDGCIVAPHLTC